MAFLSSSFRLNTMVFCFILWFVTMVLVFSPSELVCYTPNLSLCTVLVPLDTNLDGFSGELSATVDSLSIDSEFPSIVE